MEQINKRQDDFERIWKQRGLGVGTGKKAAQFMWNAALEHAQGQGEPLAYAAFADNENIRIWTAKIEEAKRLSIQIGQPLQPLFAGSPLKSILPEGPQKCDGDHGGPRCSDPECWNDSDQESTPTPMPENEVHKVLKRFVNRRQQGNVMGALRELGLVHDPRQAKVAHRDPLARRPTATPESRTKNDWETLIGWLDRRRAYPSVQVTGEVAGDIADALASALRAGDDMARLDFLDHLNRTLNNRYGTQYRWSLVLSPNIVRLMSGPGGDGHVAAIDLHDSESNGLHSCRDAIDAARVATRPNNAAQGIA